MLLLRIANKIEFNKILSRTQIRNTMNQACMVKSVKECIPPLDASKHKGQAGRIGIIGGSLEYTGAPYFAGISALKVGADLVHVFCASSASLVLKSYSPELIVHPLLTEHNAVMKISPWLDRLHAVVIGPGLGRETTTFQSVVDIIKAIKDRKIPLVIDADGLFLITERPELIKDFLSPVILTPNKVEYERLTEKIGVSGLKQLGSNVVILKKGEIDEVISSSTDVQWKLNLGGSGRRCGGQGDILSGSIATFLHWTIANINKINIDVENKEHAALSLSCYAAAILVRRCNEKAFKVKGRSMLATDMIEYIHASFEELFGQ